MLVKHVDSINDDNEDPLEPMRYEKGKITPNLVGVVPRKCEERLAVFHPASGSDIERACDAGDGSKQERASRPQDSATTEGE